MFRFFHKVALTLGLLLAPSIVLAQLGSVPHVFTSGTTISSSDMNANFSTAYSTALNRTGGTMTGSLTTLAIVPTADALYDMGTTLAKYRDFFLSRNALIGGTLGVTGAVTLSSTLASGAITATGSSTIGSVTLSGGVVTATSFSGSGATLTSIPETAITDGSLLARLAANETVSGLWSFTGSTVSLTYLAPFLKFIETDAGTDLKNWGIVVDGNQWEVRNYDDAFAIYSSPFNINKATNAITIPALLTVGSLVSGSSIAGTTTFTTGGTITSTGGNILGDNGTVRGLSVVSLGALTAATNVVATAGTVTAGTSMTAGTSITASNGNITTSAGNLVASSGNLVVSGGFFEHGRSSAAGVAVSRGFSAGNYTGLGGAWTVGAGDMSGESYRITGNTMWFQARIVTSTIAASVTQLRIAIPTYTAIDNVRSNCSVVDGATGTLYLPSCGVDASGTYVYIFYENGAAFVTGTDNQSVYVNLFFTVS